eukprot:m51a1_g5594 putative signal recognition particle subunit srp68 isoform x1 (630) ;mRNA; f:661437-663568
MGRGGKTDKKADRKPRRDAEQPAAAAEPSPAPAAAAAAPATPAAPAAPAPAVEAPADAVAAVAQPAEPAEKFCHKLGVFGTIKQSQMQNGLRHEDYERYRAYCARRLHRIRKSLDFTCGKNTKYVKKDVTSANARDPRHLLLVLVCAERSWAHYMSIKQQTPLPAFSRLHMINRLKKAVHYAATLEAVCSAAAEPRTVVEAKAYHAWMSGNLALERQCWAEAHAHYEVARGVCEQLSRVGFTEQQALMVERLEELAPKLKYCAYHMKQQKAPAAPVEADAGLQALVEGVVAAASTGCEETGVKAVAWKGNEVPVRNEKVRVRLAAAHEAAKAAASCAEPEERYKLHERVFTVLSDATQQLRNEKAGQIRHGVKPEALKDTDCLTDYVTYLRLMNSIERSVWIARAQQHRIPDGALSDDSAPAIPANLAKRSVRAEDIARLYDVACGSASEAATLTGDPAVSARLLCLRAMRAYYVALTFLSQAKHTDAYIIFSRTLSLVASARARNAQGADQLTTVESAAQKYRVISQARAAAAALKEKPAEAQAAVTGSGRSAQAAPSIEDDPDAWDPAWEDQRRFVGNFPPQMEIVPPRPIVFDLAFAEVDYPSLEHRTKAHAAQPAKSGGFFSFWR